MTICTKEKEKLFWATSKPLFDEFTGSPINRYNYNAEWVEFGGRIVRLTKCGVYVNNAIEYINEHNENIYIDKYVIMPNHLHLIVMVNDGGGTSGMPSPTENIINNRANEEIPKFVSSLKRFTNKQAGFSMWQRSYVDRIIRDENEYQVRWKYIENNPLKWELGDDDYYW